MGSRTIVIVAVIFAFVSMTSALAQPSVHPIGDFAQLRETGEHVYGFILRLWRDGEDVVGIWSQADGQPADFPTVAAENVTLDPASGALRFTIRWCGVVSQFTGTLTRSGLSGRLVRSGAEPESIVMRRGTDMRPVQLRDEWRWELDAILKRRAPKC
jgi:hypothetical protein